MRKEKIQLTYFISCVIIVIMLFVLFSLFKTDNKNNINQKITEQNNENQIKLEENSNTWFIKEEELHNEKEEEIEKQIEITNTINLSWKSWDNDLCTNIENLDKKNECLNNSYATNASKENNIVYCKKITDSAWKNRCIDDLYFKDAISKNDKSICEKILNNELKYNCISTIIFTTINDSSYKWWIEICNQLKDSDKTNCESKFYVTSDVELLKAAISLNDISKCKKIVTTNLKNKCNDVINLKTAISTKNISNCELIIDSSFKQQCSDTLTKILNN